MRTMSPRDAWTIPDLFDDVIETSDPGDGTEWSYGGIATDPDVRDAGSLLSHALLARSAMSYPDGLSMGLL